VKFAAFKESKVGLILAERRAIPICCSAIEPLEAEARARGTLRLEGKEYIVKDGDVMHIRHSG